MNSWKLYLNAMLFPDDEKLHLNAMLFPDDERFVWRKNCSAAAHEKSAWTQMECRRIDTQMAFTFIISQYLLQAVFGYLSLWMIQIANTLNW